MRDLRITIRAIPHSDQRYPTVGDWTFDEVGDSDPKVILHVKVSQLSDWRREFLVGIHEVIEAMLCKHDGVTQQQVDEFDMNFEANRKDGDESEPGDDAKAPYCRQHRIASAIEAMLAVQLGVHWSDYEDELSKLP